ncbi:hypothetical protein ERJ75_000663300 [Trypanosoma vivax]|nr:hypothetical protein ERJ75_000663300 [Trypanosoma vivax]
MPRLMARFCPLRSCEGIAISAVAVPVLCELIIHLGALWPSGCPCRWRTSLGACVSACVSCVAFGRGSKSGRAVHGRSFLPAPNCTLRKADVSAASGATLSCETVPAVDVVTQRPARARPCQREADAKHVPPRPVRQPCRPATRRGADQRSLARTSLHAPASAGTPQCGAKGARAQTKHTAPVRVMRRSAREHGGGREDASREPGTQGRGSRDAQGRVLRRDPRQLRRRVRTRSQLESRSTRAPEPSAQRPAATARRRSSCVGGPHAIGRRSAARGNWQRSAAMPRVEIRHAAWLAQHGPRQTKHAPEGMVKATMSCRAAQVGDEGGHRPSRTRARRTQTAEQHGGIGNTEQLSRRQEGAQASRSGRALNTAGGECKICKGKGRSGPRPA